MQLYSVRSRASWGHGDLRDLADLAAWSGRELGADFVLVNPLHAAEPLPPVSPSPYLPMSRRQISPLYLRIEDIPEYQGLSAGRPGPGRRAGRAAARREHHRGAHRPGRGLDRQARRARADPHGPARPASRRAELDAFLARDRRAIGDWATWCAIAEVHGPDWRSWPAALADPGSAEVAELRRTLADRVEFHAWLQWLAAEQLAAAQRAARRAGMSIGVITDLAVGAHPGGADAWARQDVIVPGISVGAPPDEFNQRGQNWTLPPWHPGRLAAQAGRPLAELIAASTRHAGGLRVDHVMGLARLWWIPAGMSPDLGTYVRYDHELMGGVLAAEVARADALAIGEDLGTVEPWLRKFLAERRVLGTSMLWFERRADGTPRRPGGWRRGCLATVGTHDMPPAAAFLTGEQVTIRAKLGLLTQPEAEERAAAQAEMAGWLAMLAREDLLPRQARPSPEEFTVALYAYLTRTPGRADRRLAGRSRGRTAAAEHAGHGGRVPQLADPAHRRRRTAGAARGPARARRGPGGRGGRVRRPAPLGPGHAARNAGVPRLAGGAPRCSASQPWRLDPAAAGELRVGLDRADDRAAEPATLGVPYWASLPKVWMVFGRTLPKFHTHEVDVRPERRRTAG